MNPISEFLASNLTESQALLLIFVAAVLIVMVSMLPYLEYMRRLKKKAHQSFLDNLDNANISDRERARQLAWERYPMPKEYEKRAVVAGFSFLFGCLGLMAATMALVVWPVLYSYSDCSRTVQGQIIVPGYDSESHEFTLCRKREYYGAEWSDWYVADKIYNNKPR